MQADALGWAVISRQSSGKSREPEQPAFADAGSQSLSLENQVSTFLL